MNGHIDVGAWNFTFVAMLVLAAVQAIDLIRKRRRRPGIRSIFPLADDPTRIAAGFALVCVGLIIRIGGWLPWRPMLLADDRGLAVWYQEQAWVWTGSGALICATGLAILFWPIFLRLRLIYALFAVPAGVMILYGIGAALTWIVGTTFFGATP